MNTDHGIGPTYIDLHFLTINQDFTASQAIDVATNSGMPALNMFVADKNGDIGWALVGTLPDLNIKGGVNTFPIDEKNQWQDVALPAAQPSVFLILHPALGGIPITAKTSVQAMTILVTAVPI
ncbi:penicillin acylase family protein [Yersinia thracica]|uniref:penicillin acylase family protein n=1 Tax=Yersinia thracica TaxID=2890319 RepID=UPI00119E03B5|nr:penicillin acylase family protein [Yersinia thracica]